MSRKYLTIATFMAASLLFGCSGDPTDPTPPIDPIVEVTETINDQGGEVTSGDYTVLIPEGAVDGEVVITIDDSDAILDPEIDEVVETLNTPLLIHIEGDSLHADSEVTITLPPFGVDITKSFIGAISGGEWVGFPYQIMPDERVRITVPGWRSTRRT